MPHRYGLQLILEDRPKEDKEYTPAVLVIVFFGVLSGAQNMGLTSPHLEAFAIARGSAAAVFQVLDRVPTIDSLSAEGEKLQSVHGDIEFQKVEFRYPARKDVQVLRGLNLKINRGETVALVGGSGCGKSTCLQLIQRLYDPIGGQVRAATRFATDGSLVSLVFVETETRDFQATGNRVLPSLRRENLPISANFPTATTCAARNAIRVVTQAVKLITGHTAS